MSVRRTTARGVRLNCPKCATAFTVVAFLSQGIDASDYWKARAEEHDCAAHQKLLDSMKNADGTRNPLKASKAGEV